MVLFALPMLENRKDRLLYLGRNPDQGMFQLLCPTKESIFQQGVILFGLRLLLLWISTIPLYMLS